MRPLNWGLKRKLGTRDEPLVQPDTTAGVSFAHESAVPPPTEKPTSEPSAARNFFSRSWDFTQTLVKRLPEVVDENPVKVVLGLVKLVAEIKEVRRF